MRFSLAAAALSVAGVYAADHIVTVGENNLLAFNPTSVTAAEGDNIIFQFRSKNHSVTQSSFASPCVASGIDSGFQMTPADATQFATWSFTVNNASAPLWFFCAQTNPATAGMVFAVNPTQEKSFDAFQAIAKGDNGTASASGAAGAGGASATDSSGASATDSSSASATDSAGSSPAVSGGDPSGTDSATGANTTAGTQGATSGSNGAMRMGANTISLITLAGLVAGLVL
ncbi:hypothetical protein VKT23_004412 [Stygiomarasmius scandens]|uniref:Cupredoxin n=1 Tax=Marasmiellus scandens TaxID=2682957 RepID=A0ABR1JUU8_9AGAR